jgi:hypothetical protein
MDESPKPTTATHTETGGILRAIVDAFSYARQAIANLADEFTRDLRRAGLTVMWMVALGVLAAILIAGAWFGFMVALALWFVALGLSWAGAIALVALVNFLGAIVVIAVATKLSRNFLFPATRRQLTARSSSSKDTSSIQR